MKRQVPYRRVEGLMVDHGHCRQLGCHFFASADEFEQLGGHGEPENAGFDFNRDLGVVICRGECPTGGYGIRVQAVWVNGDTMVIDVKLRDPGPGAFVTMVITYPSEIIAVNRRGFDQFPQHVVLCNSNTGDLLVELEVQQGSST